MDGAGLCPAPIQFVILYMNQFSVVSLRRNGRLVGSSNAQRKETLAYGDYCIPATIEAYQPLGTDDAQKHTYECKVTCLQRDKKQMVLWLLI